MTQINSSSYSPSYSQSPSYTSQSYSPSYSRTGTGSYSNSYSYSNSRSRRPCNKCHHKKCRCEKTQTSQSQRSDTNEYSNGYSNSYSRSCSRREEPFIACASGNCGPYDPNYVFNSPDVVMGWNAVGGTANNYYVPCGQQFWTGYTSCNSCTTGACGVGPNFRGYAGDWNRY